MESVLKLQTKNLFLPDGICISTKKQYCVFNPCAVTYILAGCIFCFNVIRASVAGFIDVFIGVIFLCSMRILAFGLYQKKYPKAETAKNKAAVSTKPVLTIFMKVL